jgi:peptide/nickel transport system substrate-binding protein
MISRRALLKQAGRTGAVAAVSAGYLLEAGSRGQTKTPPSVSGSAAPAQEIEQITFGLNGSGPEVLFVPRAWNIGTGMVVSLAQEGLVAFGDDLTVVPALAESWEIADPTTYVYHLRDGLMFHDGSPVTADDIVFSMLLQVDPEAGSQLGQFYRSVDTIQATDPKTVTVKLQHPDALFQYTPANLAGFVFPKAFYEQHPEDIGTPSVLIPGTGPFRITEYVPNESVTLERFEDYWGPKPAVKKVIIKFIPDQQTRLLALQSGDLDGEFDVNLAVIEQYENAPGINVITTPGLGFLMFTLNVNAPPWNDIHVRRAIAHCIDKEGLVQAVLHAKGEPLDAINPPRMWAGVLEEDQVRSFYATLPKYDYDLDKARQELAQSAYPEGFDWVFDQSDNPAQLLGSQSLAENLSKIGIRVTLNVRDDWFDDLISHKGLGLEVQGYNPDFADPSAYPFLFLHSVNSHQDGSNTSEYRNPQVDALIDKSLQSTDPAVRAEAIQGALTTVANDLPVLPVFTAQTAVALSDKFEFKGFNAFWYNIPWANRGFGLAP